VPVVQHPHHVHPLTPLITYSNEHFTPGNPPPHLPADVDPKTGRWKIVLGFERVWVDLSVLYGEGFPMLEHQRRHVKCQMHVRIWTK